MALLQRFTTPFVALLPDLNNVPQQRQAVGAIVASVVFHLLLLLFFVAMAGLVPDVRVEFAKPAAELQPLELTVIDTSPPPAVDTTPAELLSAEELKARAEKPVIDSTGLAKSEEKPKDGLFESDQNMKAASEKPATGDLPLPSQDGRKADVLNFKDQDVSLGTASVPQMTIPEPAPAEPLTPPKPEPAEEAVATPMPVARATPVPAPEVLTPAEDQIAIAPKMTEVKDGPVTKLAPAFRTRPVPSPQERTEVAKLITPPPKASREDSGFQDLQRKTQVDGGITNRGMNSVDANQTPRGVYAKQVKAAIGSRWYHFMKQHPDRYAIGSVKLRYSITRDGKIADVRVEDNTSNASFGLMCERCVREAELTPPPSDVVETMPGEKFEDTFTFTILPPL